MSSLAKLPHDAGGKKMRPATLNRLGIFWTKSSYHQLYTKGAVYCLGHIQIGMLEFS